MKPVTFDRSVWVAVLKGLILTASLFCMTVSVLLIANRVQSVRTDPLNTPALQIFLESVRTHPEDVTLREQIRELNLLARKAYFTIVWQQRTGSILLLAGMIVLIASVKEMQSLRFRIQVPDQPSDAKTDWLERILSRKWITITGFSLFGLALTVSLIPVPKLQNQPLIASSEMQVLKTEDPETVQQAEPEQTGGQDSGDYISPIENEKSASESKSDSSVLLQSVSESKTGKIPASPPKSERIARWPNFRGPGGNGVSDVKNAPVEWDASTGKHILWKTKLPLHGNSSPVLWGEHLFLTGGSATEQVVYCFSIKDGQLLWKQVIPGTPGSIKNLNEDTGFAPNTVATDGTHICAIFPTGALAGLDFSGQILWSQNFGIPDNHYGYASSLIIYENILIVQWDQNTNSRLLGLEVSTGKKIWQTPRTVISWSSPICVNTGNRMELILTNSKSVTSFDPKTGRQLWNVDCMSGEMGPSAVYSNGMVYASNDYATTAAIRITDSGAALVWENDDELPDTASPLATGEHVFIATSYGVIVCLNAKTGEMLWDVEFDDGFYASPILVDSHIYALDMQGLMHIFRTGNTYQSVGESSVGEPCVATPAFTDGRIYIRGEKHLFCIEGERNPEAG